MRARVRRAADWLAGRAGYELRRLPASADGRTPPPDFDDFTTSLFERVRDLTLTSPERVYALAAAMRYITRAKVPGAVVECGVWRGGSMLAAAITLLDLGVDDRDLYLYDTFASRMPPPGPRDVDVYGVHAAEHHARLAAGEPPDPRYLGLPAEEVGRLVEATGYPRRRIHVVEGLVEESIPARAPEQIAVLRLDTDYESSTRHEMEHLFPRIPPKGVLLVDDYGHFAGARAAVDEYLEARGIVLLLDRIDYSARIAVVPEEARG
jgi:hypothetical protein